MISEAQKEAGNYPKKHVRIHGLDISIENRKGTVRRGDGWSVVMPYDYGYLKRTTGADGDQVDVFLGPRLTSEFVVVVNQYDNSTGKFDEVKVGIGYANMADARAAYRRGYSGRNVPHAIFKATTMQKFKAWLKTKVSAHSAFVAAPVRLTSLELGMKQTRIVNFRAQVPPYQQPRQEKKRSIAGKVAAVAGGAAALGGFYFYRATRPEAIKHRRYVNYRANRAAVLTDPARKQRLATTAQKMSAGRVPPAPTVAPKVSPPAASPVSATPKVTPTENPVVKVEGVAAHPDFAAPRGESLVKKAAPVAVASPPPTSDPRKAVGTHIKAPAAEIPKLLDDTLDHKDVTRPRTKKAVIKAKSASKPAAPKPAPAPVVAKKPAAKKKTVIKMPAKKAKKKLMANIRLIQFQDRNRDGTMGVSTNPLSAYRKASRIVPWVRRAGEAAGDLGDMAAGKKVKDPFYKKPWFKRAVATAAVAVPIMANSLARSGERKQADLLRPREGKTIGAKWDRATHKAANIKRTLRRKVGFSAPVKTIELANCTLVLREFETKKKDSRGVASVVGTAVGTGAGIHYGGKMGTKAGFNDIERANLRADFLRSVETEAWHGVPAKAAPIYVNSKQGQAIMRQARRSGKLFGGALGMAVGARIGHATGLGLNAARENRKKGRQTNFSYEDVGGWQLRDARGKSTRVFAPGSKKRERRQKEWGEKTENIRLVRNVAIGAAVAGTGGMLFYRNKAKRLGKALNKAQTPDNVVHGPWRRKEAAAKIRLTEFRRQDVPAIDRITEAVANNVGDPTGTVDGVEAVAGVAKRPLVKRAVIRVAKIGGGGVIGGVVGSHYGSQLAYKGRTLARRGGRAGFLGGVVTGAFL